MLYMAGLMTMAKLKAWAGDAFLMLVEWGKDGNVSSESIHQYGSNTQHKESTHYSDQAPLFVERKRKPVWMKLESIKKNLRGHIDWETLNYFKNIIYIYLN